MAQLIITYLLLAGGLFFLAVSSIGVVRLPDFYSRCHAVGKSETLGSMLVLLGLAIFNGLDVDTWKILIILVFVALANPTATHIVARAAYRTGLKPWIITKRRTTTKTGKTENQIPADNYRMQDKKA
jgi:multicomponent Na+:H+ antiporter subunit G